MQDLELILRVVWTLLVGWIGIVIIGRRPPNILLLLYLLLEWHVWVVNEQILIMRLGLIWDAHINIIFRDFKLRLRSIMLNCILSCQSLLQWLLSIRNRLWTVEWISYLLSLLVLIIETALTITSLEHISILGFLLPFNPAVPCRLLIAYHLLPVWSLRWFAIPE